MSKIVTVFKDGFEAIYPLHYNGVVRGGLVFKAHILVYHSALGSRVIRKKLLLFRGGLVFKAHTLLYRSILGSRVIKKRKKLLLFDPPPTAWFSHHLCLFLAHTLSLSLALFFSRGKPQVHPSLCSVGALWYCVKSLRLS